MSPHVYLDHNATTPLSPEAFDAMLPFLREDFGNPSSIHAIGRVAKGAVLDAREAVARFLSGRATEVVFTASGTEADNLAILGVVSAAEEDRSPRAHLVTSSIEHHAVLNVMKQLEKKGYEVSYLPVDHSGQVSVAELERVLRNDTLLVSIMYANNETGVLQPVRELAALAHDRGALFHTDAVQACGKVPVDIAASDFDLLSLSAHKFYGPKGVGALHVKSGTAFRPVLRGGSQERSRRPGTENVAGIVGLAAAARKAGDVLAGEARALASLRDELERTVLRDVTGSHVNGAGAQRVSNTVNFRFDAADGEEIVHALDRAGFAVSTGAACSAGAVSPSHVLIAMGLTPDKVQGSIRVSLGRFTTPEQTADFAPALGEAVRSSRTKKRHEVGAQI